MTRAARFGIWLISRRDGMRCICVHITVDSLSFSHRVESAVLIASTAAANSM